MISKLALGLVLLFTSTFSFGQTAPKCNTDFCIRVDQNTKTVSLEVKSRQQPAAHAFTLGDGTFLRGEKVSHTFSQAGTYEICLKTIAFDSTIQQRCTSEVCKEVQIVECDRLQANFRYVVDGLTVKVVGTTNSNNVSTGFRFGDGSGVRKDSAKHTYDKPGIYEICYIAEDYTYGCRKEVCKKIVVRDDNDCALRARFTIRQDGGIIKLAAEANQKLVAYEWFLGDGNTAKGAEVRHQYEKPGIYRVCLRVSARSKDSGEVCTTTICEKVVVRKPECDLKADFTFEKDGLNLKLAARANGTGLHYLWIYGDGSDATGKFSRYSYDAPGTYEVGLVVVDPVTKCKTCVWKTIVIEKPCGLKAAIALRQADENVVLHARTNASRKAKYYWDLGDGTQQRGQTIKHTYRAKGKYTVLLTVVDRKKGCTETQRIVLWVGPKPRVKQQNLQSSPTNTTDVSTVEPDLPTWDAQVSPNPAKSEVAISSQDIVLQKVKVYGADGVLLQEVEGTLEHIDISAFPAGFYHAHIYAADGSIKVKKFLKN